MFPNRAITGILPLNQIEEFVESLPLKEGYNKEEIYKLYLNHLKDVLIDDGFYSQIMQFLCNKNLEPVWLTSGTCKDYGFSTPGFFLPFEPWLSKPNVYGQIRNGKVWDSLQQTETKKFIKYLNPKGVTKQVMFLGKKPYIVV
uniref:Uncharacterized protein n=1 Tax=Codium arenicola TaxID=1191365 RepID=A0A2P0QHZ7_9CHLO|nr:hypothetical protein [Codium arenicola]ARO74376.1 hypothetical protein [Codium arenicola]